MAANPNYDSAGEIPVAARGTGIQTIDGFMERTPFESQLDLAGVVVALKIAAASKLTFMADVFNLFNEQRITELRSEHPAERRHAESGFRQAGQLAAVGHAAAVPGAVQRCASASRFEF